MGARRPWRQDTCRRQGIGGASSADTDQTLVAVVIVAVLATLFPALEAFWRASAKLLPVDDAVRPFWPASDALLRSFAKLPGFEFPEFAIFQYLDFVCERRQVPSSCPNRGRAKGLRNHRGTDERQYLISRSLPFDIKHSDSKMTLATYIDSSHVFTQ